MQTRILGKDMTVSAVGLGCMGFSHAYGAPTEDKEAIQMIREAFEMGYTMFDTAECYGTADDPHVNERLVGEAVKPFRDKVQLVSKFGIHFDLNDGKVNHDLISDARPEVIRASVEGSLKRLQTDHIDLYFQHRIDTAVEPETVAEVMADLIREGKILHWGISEATATYLQRAHAVCPVTAVENRYSMMARQYEALFPLLEELQVGLVAFSTMANGFLTGKYGKDAVLTSSMIIGAVCRSFAKKAMRKIRNCCHYSIVWQKKKTEHQRRFLWHGCCAKSRTLFPSPVHASWSVCGKMREQQILF